MATKSVGLNEAYSQLKRYHLSKSLTSLGYLTSCFDINYDLPLRQPESSKEDLSQFVKWANQNNQRREERFGIAWILYRLARLLILSESDDYKKIIFTPDMHKLQTLYNLAANLEELTIDIPPDFHGISLFFYRTIQSQAWLQGFMGHQLGRSHLMFGKILKESRPEVYEKIELLFQKYYGVTSIEWSMILIAISLLSPGKVSGRELLTTFPELSRFLTEDKVTRICTRLSLTKTEYMRAIRGDDYLTSHPAKDLYAFEPLRLKPFFRPNPKFTVDTFFVIPNTQALITKASDGLFHETLDLLEDEQGPKASKNFREIFGDTVLKNYILFYLQHYCDSRVQVIDLDEESSEMRPDIALVFDNICILIETKLSLTNMNSRHLGDIRYVHQHFQTGQNLRKGIEQLESYAVAVRSGAAKQVPKTETIVSLLVSLDLPVLSNSYLLQLCEAELGFSATRYLQFGSLSEIEEMFVWFVGGHTVFGDLVEKCEDIGTSRRWPISSFFEKRYGLANYDHHLIRDLAGDYLDEWKRLLQN